MKLFQAFLDFVAPWTCAACDALLAGADSPFCSACAPLLEPQPYGVGAFSFGGPLADAIRRFKYGLRPELGPRLGALMVECALARHAGRVDVIVPIPLHPRRLAERGFDQTVGLSRPLSRALGIPLRLRALRRNRWTAPQASLPREARASNVRGAFSVRAEDLRAARVLLMDDVYTSGATMDAAANALAHAGCRSIRRFTLAQAES